AAGILAVTLGARWLGRFATSFQQRSPWLLALGLFLTLWEVATAKFAWLPLPFFPPPQSIAEVYTDDLPKLLDSVFASVKLQLGGYVVGATIGFLTGVSIGWSRSVGYWIHPVLRFIGPLPATAWLPIAFFTFPSSWSASTFLIALATGFPVTVLTWSGVASVQTAYYDVARTLGASPRFLILKVAIPAALPHVFVGLFMGLGSSFAVLVVAEMLGVKSGLGWYLQWAQGWAAYANMYGALLVMGLDRPRRGRLVVDGKEVRGPDPSRVVVFQDPTLYPWRTVWRNASLGLEARGLLRQQRARVDAALELVGLQSFAAAFPHQL